MSSVNKVILLGNLGADPELRYTQSQMPVSTLRIATNDRRKGPDGNWVDNTEWHSVVVFGKSAENCHQYLQKGRLVFVEGRIQTRKWQDQEGKDRYTTEIIANNIQFIGGRGEGFDSERAMPRQNSAPSPEPAAAATLGTQVSFDDDDIPF